MFDFNTDPLRTPDPIADSPPQYIELDQRTMLQRISRREAQYRDSIGDNDGIIENDEGIWIAVHDDNFPFPKK